MRVYSRFSSRSKVSCSQPVEQQPTDRAFPPQQTNSTAAYDKVFSEDNLATARTTLAFTSVVAVLILYLMFRAINQSIFEDDPKYDTLQVIPVSPVFACPCCLLFVKLSFFVFVCFCWTWRAADVSVPACCLLPLSLSLARPFAMSLSPVVHAMPPRYWPRQSGMFVIVVGVLLQALDALSVRLHSDVFGNISLVVGTALSYTGYIMLLWGLFAVGVCEGLVTKTDRRGGDRCGKQVENFFSGNGWH